MVVRAVLCDLGGVVIRIDASRTWAGWAAHSTRPETDPYAPYADEVYERFERDEVTEGEYLQAVRDRLSLDATDDELVASFNDLYLGVDDGTVAVLRILRDRGALVLALTNTNRTHHRVWSERFADSLEVFDDVHCSHDLRARKPEAEAFLRILEMHGLAPEEVVFIDDVPAYVEAARALGLHAITFLDADDLAHRLAQLDWLDEAPT